MTRGLAIPAALRSGDAVAVVAPCGALKERGAVDRALEILRSRGYRVRFGTRWLAREGGYLAGPDAGRRQDLAAAWQDPEVRAIFCLRGGYGSMRLLETWDWPPGPPKWLVGFSDATGLLWNALGAGVACLHGPVLTTLAAEPDWSQQRLFDCLEGRAVPTLVGTGWGSGAATGPLLPGNLAIATHLLGTRQLPDLSGAILAIEDVTEVPYRVDRYLTHWRLSGQLSELGGIAIGRFSRCKANTGWTVEEVLRDRLGDLGLPIVSNLPFGHDGVNAALPVGLPVRLDAATGTLSWDAT